MKGGGHMKKRNLLIVLAVIAVFAVPFSVFAASSNAPVAKAVRGFFGIDTSKLTDKQKNDVKDYVSKLADLQKDFINKMVSNGAMTKEQGDAALKQIDDMAKNGNQNGFIPGFGMGRNGFKGPGKHGDMGFARIDTSKLTDQQKAGLMETYKKMTDLQKEHIGKLVADGLLTKTQGDSAAAKIDEMAKSLQENGFPRGLGMPDKGFGFLGAGGIDTSKLTEQQKADLKDYSDKMKALQKEVLNKLVGYGLITQAQADTCIQKMDEMAKLRQENGFNKGMGKGRSGKRGMDWNRNHTGGSTSNQGTAM